MILRLMILLLRHQPRQPRQPRRLLRPQPHQQLQLLPQQQHRQRQQLLLQLLPFERLQQFLQN
jgi:hypothetical protein